MCKERTLTGDAIPGWNQLHDEDGLGFFAAYLSCIDFIKKNVSWTRKNAVNILFVRGFMSLVFDLQIK